MYEYKRTIWEAGDRVFGLFVIDNRSTYPCSDEQLSFAASVTYKIGFICAKGGNEYTSTSIQDGMTLVIGDKQKIIEYLNKGSQGDGFRIIELDTLQKIIDIEAQSRPRDVNREKETV
jgi:hypothetical protein